VALAPDGGAVVAWRDGYGDGVHAAARPPGGGFGAPVRLSSREASAFSSFGALATSGGPPVDDDDRIRVAAGAGGRGAVGWIESGTAFGAPASVRLAQRSGANFARPLRIGSPVRDADRLVPWLGLAEPAVVWTDNRTAAGIVDAYPAGLGRLHLSRPAAPVANPPAPDVRVRVPRRTIYAADPLVVDLDCAAACDVRAAVLPRGGRRRTGEARGGAIATGGRTTPGRLRLRAAPLSGAIAPRAGGVIRLVVRATAPGGREVERQALRVRVRRRTPPPFQRPLAVRAHRAGDDVIVRWRTAGPARRMSFAAFGFRTRGNPARGEEPPSAYRDGDGDRRFRARLTGAARVRWVAVYAWSIDGPGRSVRVWARVR
jgi:hypothetical protein